MFVAFAEVNFVDGTTVAFSRTGLNAAEAAARLGMSIANHGQLLVWPEVITNEIDRGADLHDFHFTQDRTQQQVRDASKEEMFQAEQQARHEHSEKCKRESFPGCDRA